MKATVYWLHLPTHSDIYSEGYVGVSTNYEIRIDDHFQMINSGKHENAHLLNAIRRSGNTILKVIVAQGTEDYCYKLESKLRPKREIGWNIAEGGNKPPSQKNKIWINDGKNHKRINLVDREKYTDWNDGRINVFSEDEKNRRKHMYLGNNNPFFGKKHSQKTKEKNSEWHLGRLPSNAKKTTFEGIEYESLADASRQTGISTYLIQKEVSKCKLVSQ